MIKYNKWILGVMLLLVFLVFLNEETIYAQNYKLKKSVIDQGGGWSQSTNSKLLDAVGLTTPIGASNSTNYRISSGLFFGGVIMENPVLAVSPITLDFGKSQTSLTFQIQNNGSGTLEWTVQETPDKPWITSINPNKGSNNAMVTVNVDHAKLIGGSDTGTLLVSSNGGNQNVTVKIGDTGDGNILVNGDFSGGIEPWRLYVHESANANGTVENGEFHIAINNGGTSGWHIQLIQDNLLIENGKTYFVSFDAYAASSRKVSPCIVKIYRVNNETKLFIFFYDE